jgi:hypothetical protein
MPIPTAADHALAEIENLSNAIIIKLKTACWGHTPDRQGIAALLASYATAVRALAGIEEGDAKRRPATRRA